MSRNHVSTKSFAAFGRLVNGVAISVALMAVAYGYLGGVAQFAGVA